MEYLKAGHYWLADENGNLYTSFWNGEHFLHGGGVHYPHQNHKVIAEDVPQCQTGCVCTQNPDGTWKINCA